MGRKLFNISMELQNTTSPSPAFTGNVRGICPIGWHIPTLSEFTTLQTTVGG